jgi:formylglycine-generating enzyme required for sulfatase activity
MSETIPPEEKKSSLRIIIITVVSLFGIILLGAGGFFLVNPPQSPADQTQTAEAVRDAVLITMTARAQIETEVAFSIFQTMTALAPTSTPTITPTATPPATPTNAFPPGTLQQNPGDGEQLVFIPAGEFTMGTNASSAQALEKPAHTVYTDPFWIYQTQVTNAMFAKCIAAGSCVKGAGGVDPHFTNPTYANHPVVYVTWDEAISYCAWQGGRMPTEAEWEKAARGTSSRFYPWGEISAGPEITNANNSVGNTTAVGSYPKYPSFYGLLDMGGNVREWVMDWYSETYYSESPKYNPTGPADGAKRVLRGASYFDPYEMAQSTNRLAHAPGSAGNNRGFRCVIPIIKSGNQ